MSTGRRVLMVDDDVDFVDAVRLTLEAAGYEVVSANTGEEALALVRERPVDVAILDMMMEEPDAGAMVALGLRRRPEMEKIPVILVTSVTEKTGYRVETDTRQGRKWLGIDVRMDKPVDPRELLRTSERLTNG